MLKHLLRGGGGSGLEGDSWVATLGRGEYDYDYGRSVAIGPDGSVYVCGYTDPLQAATTTTPDDGFIAKFDSSGTLQWQKTLVGKYDERGDSVAVGPDGSVYVCVYQYDADGNITACPVVKFDSSGKLQFQKALGWSKHTYGQSVAIGPDGSVYVCGYTYIVEHYGRYDCLSYCQA